MAKRSTTKVDYQLENQVKPPPRRLRLIRNVRYRYADKDGNIIQWDGAGSTNYVSEEDAIILLSKKRAGGCCGIATSLSSVFEEVL